MIRVANDCSKCLSDEYWTFRVNIHKCASFDSLPFLLCIFHLTAQLIKQIDCTCFVIELSHPRWLAFRSSHLCIFRKTWGIRSIRIPIGGATAAGKWSFWIFYPLCVYISTRSYGTMCIGRKTSQLPGCIYEKKQLSWLSIRTVFTQQHGGFTSVTD